MKQNLKMEEYRKKGKEILSNYSKILKNQEILERRIYDFSSKDSETKEEIYYDTLYQIAYFFENGKKIKEVINILKEGKLGYDHEDFDLCRIKQKEYDEYLVNPFSVENGLLDCIKCKSKRTISYYRQDRSSDEGTSVYSQCLDCKYKWRENN